jgi:hypothetical protein
MTCIYIVGQYVGPPCREHCGFYECFEKIESFTCLGDAIMFYKTYNNHKSDNIVIFKNNVIMKDALFCFRWFKDQVCGIPLFGEFKQRNIQYFLE